MNSDLETLLTELGALYLEKRLIERDNSALRGRLAVAEQRVIELEGQESPGLGGIKDE